MFFPWGFLLGIRFNLHDWYVAFALKYISGQARSDQDENSEVLWVPVKEAFLREDVPDLTKRLIECALQRDRGFVRLPYESKNNKYGEPMLYGIR